MADPQWRTFEQHVQRVLRLQPTPGSGNQFHAPSDGLDPRHPSASDFRLLVDCKCTEHSSISLRLLTLTQWTQKALEWGYRFVLPIRFHVKATNRNSDFVLIGLRDFADLCERAGVLGP